MTEFSSPTPPSPDAVSMKRVLIGAALLSALVIGIWMVLGVELRGYGDSLTPGGVTISSDRTPATDLDEASIQQSMNQGVSLLYEHGDAQTAIGHFSAVLALNAKHYGALYQIAKAFEQSQQLRLAHRAWREFEPLAQESTDTPSLVYATERIAALEDQMTALDEQMNTGVDLLHVQGRPDDAVPYFEEVRNAWPTHYGARYQHAVALEQSGQNDAAEGAWHQFLAAAEASKSLDDMEVAKAAILRVRAHQENPEPG